jgi:hypothetical protein
MWPNMLARGANAPAISEEIVPGAEDTNLQSKGSCTNRPSCDVPRPTQKWDSSDASCAAMDQDKASQACAWISKR